MRISDWSSDVCSSDLWTTAMDAGAAAIMRGAMLGVVTDGTASRLSIPGFEVGGKTGTAQPGTDPPRSHAWIMGFAGPPGEAATIRTEARRVGKESVSPCRPTGSPYH